MRGQRGISGDHPTDPNRLYRGHRFPPEVISDAILHYFRFPLNLGMVEEMLAARGIGVMHETVRQWGKNFGKGIVMSGRRSLIKGYFWRRADRGCGHVFGLCVRK